MPRCRHAFAVLFWASLFVTAAAETIGQTFVVSGTLVSDGRSVIEGATVMIAEANENGFALSIDDFGRANPSVITDAKGRFSITVRRSLFKDRREFVIVVPVFAGVKQIGRFTGRVETVKIDPTRNEYKLGKIARDSPIIR